MKQILKIVLATYNTILPPKEDKKDKNWLNYINHHIYQIQSGTLSVQQILVIGNKLNDVSVWTAIIGTNRLNNSELITVGNQTKDIRIWTAILRTGLLNHTQVEQVNKIVHKSYKRESGIEWVRTNIGKLAGNKKK